MRCGLISSLAFITPSHLRFVSLLDLNILDTRIAQQPHTSGRGREKGEQK